MMAQSKWWRPVRKLLIALGWLLVVVAVFAAGVGIYVTASAYWELLLVWWRPLLAGTVAVVVLGAWWIWWRLPKWQVDRFRDSSDTDPADAEDNFRKTAGQLLGGAAVLIGAGFAYLQFQQQQTAAHDLLISNQVAKGFELLGNKDGQIEQRLGGIYALEGVMNTSEQYHQPVLEALCAFVRNETRPHLADSVAGKVLEAIRKTFGAGPTQHQPQDDLSADVQAALTVIGRRKAASFDLVNLRDAYISKADLMSAHLDHTFLNGALLNGALLNGADLRGAFLTDADLTGTHLYDAELTGTYLNGALLNGALLDGADLEGADLRGADLRGANLRGAKNLTQSQLDDACGDEDTKLDPPLTIKPCKPKQPAAGDAK